MNRSTAPKPGAGSKPRSPKGSKPGAKEMINRKCHRAMIQELQSISIERRGEKITLYDIIMTILNEDKNVDSIFCEGSLVIYMFNKICRNYTDDELIRPGDVDLHVDYHGSWYDFLGSNNHSEIQEKMRSLIDRKRNIMIERRKKPDFIAGQKHREVEFNTITNDLARLTSQNIQTTNTPICNMLDLVSPDIKTTPFNIGPERTITIATSVEFPISDLGNINWKPEPSLELTVTNIDAKKTYYEEGLLKLGFVVENIPKLYFAKDETGLRIRGENLYDNYTDISIDVDELGDASCASFIKAYELYLRYMVIPKGETFSEHIPIGPLRSSYQFQNLECVKDIPKNINNWDLRSISEDSFNEFICGMIKKIGNKHYNSHDTIKKLLILLKESLYNLAVMNMNYTEEDIETKLKPYLMICMIQCLTSGIHAKISNLSGIDIGREINNIISYISNTFNINEPDQILIIENMIKKKLHNMSNPSTHTGGPSSHRGGKKNKTKKKRANKKTNRGKTLHKKD